MYFPIQIYEYVMKNKTYILFLKRKFQNCVLLFTVIVIRVYLIAWSSLFTVIMNSILFKKVNYSHPLHFQTWHLSSTRDLHERCYRLQRVMMVGREIAKLYLTSFSIYGYPFYERSVITTKGGFSGWESWINLQLKKLFALVVCSGRGQYSGSPCYLM